MRSAVLLFGAFSLNLVTLAPACSGPPASTGTGGASSSAASTSSSSSSGAGGTGGTPIDGMQACVYYYNLAYPYCDKSPSSEVWCSEKYINSGVRCLDEFTAYFNCELDATKAEIAANTFSCSPIGGICNVQFNKWHLCQHYYGCDEMPDCDELEPGPNGGNICSCMQYCWDYSAYEYRCWPEGTQWTCECSVDGVAVGTCTQPPESHCDWVETDGYFLAYESCCGQFFEK